jgi:hypothetical protein
MRSWGSSRQGARLSDARRTAVGRTFGIELGLVVLGIVLLTGCASRLASTTSNGRERFEHRTLHYTVDRPSVLAEPGWKRVRIEESDFAVRHRDGSAFALASSCRPTRATAAQLAFHVLHATRSKRIGAGEEIEHRGLPGFVQTLERVEDGAWLRIRTVTLRGAECSYDWFLLAPDEARLEALRPAFDAWWQSFEPAPRERASATSPGPVPPGLEETTP